MDDWQPYEVRRFRAKDVKPWFFCAFAGALLGMTAAYNLGEVIDAAARFVRGADSTQASRMGLTFTLGPEMLGELPARRPAAEPARDPQLARRSASIGAFPSAALFAADERELNAVRELAPGERLALRGRLALSGRSAASR